MFHEQPALFLFTYPFMPQFHIGDQQIEFVEKLKLLGVTMTSDLKWNENTNIITKKAYNRLWLTSAPVNHLVPGLNTRL